MSSLPEGTIVNGFEIKERISQGNMGVVYKALQINLNRKVALKILFEKTVEDKD